MPRDESLEATVNLKPVHVPPSAAERFKSGLFWIAIGMLIVVFDINFMSSERTVDVVNDVLGLAAIFGGAAQARARDRSLDRARPWAIAGLVFSTLASVSADPLPYFVTAGAGITMGMTFTVIYFGIADLSRRQNQSKLAIHAKVAGVLSAVTATFALVPPEGFADRTISGGTAALLFVLLAAVIVWLVVIPFVAAKRLHDPLPRDGHPSLTGGG